MSVRTAPVVSAFIAGANLSSARHTFVKLDSSNANKVVAAGAGEEAIGILQNAPIADDHAEVVVAGGSKLIVADATFAIDAMIKSDAAGKGTVAAATDYAICRAMSAGTAADDEIEVIIEKRTV